MAGRANANAACIGLPNPSPTSMLKQGVTIGNTQRQIYRTVRLALGLCVIAADDVPIEPAFCLTASQPPESYPPYAAPPAHKFGGEASAISEYGSSSDEEDLSTAASE
jgi:hypothetical protein